MKVGELIAKLSTMSKDLDVIVWDSQENLDIATDAKIKSFCYGDYLVGISRYHHPKLCKTEKDAVFIE